MKRFIRLYAIFLLFFLGSLEAHGQGQTLKVDCNSLLAQGLGGRGFGRQSLERINPSRMSGRIARVMELAELLYGIEFYIDWDTPQVSNAENRQIFLSRDFLQNPQLGHVLHEIKHAITYLKVHPTRGIHFEAGELFASFIGRLEIYKSSYAFDELEARIVEAAASDGELKAMILEDARLFWREQKSLIEISLEKLKTVSPNAAVLLLNQREILGEEKFKSLMEQSFFIRLEGRGEDYFCMDLQRGTASLYNLCFPVRESVSAMSEAEKFKYMQATLETRLRQLETLARRL